MQAMRFFNSLARRVLPEAADARMAFALLGYLLFLFAPLLGRWLALPMLQVPFHLGATLASIALFLPLYFHLWRRGARWVPWAVVALALWLLPWNAYANTYVIYAISLLGSLPGALGRKLVQALLMLSLFGLGFHWLWPHPMVLALMLMTALIALAGLYSAHAQCERERQQAQLRLSQEEVRRIAAFAERERIGRDLHDLLGHSLSMVTLKAELAARLAGRDPARAAGEMQQVAAIARAALKEVRLAVSGIRSALLAAELASARLLLEMQGVRMHSDIASIPLPAETESALALALREAATNVQRHAGAHLLQVRLWQADGCVHLRLHDDGRGGARVSGTGLAGMRERIARLGGELQLDSPPGGGTCLHIRLPLPEAA